MEQEHEKEHVCKLCNKSFLSGRILGGHMRNHLGRNSAKEKVKLESSDMGIEGYGLRENPKKSWKSSGLNHNDSIAFQENAKCRICGKQFVSSRSLHGHMRHHSVEERNGIRCKECGKGFRTLRSLTGHMRLHSRKPKVSRESRPNLVAMTLSDTETVSLVRKKRSNRMRYKVTPNSSFSSFNESVSGFEIEQEVEEVAMCLMMLSRGVCEWGYSLDNDSLSFEAKSFYVNERNERIEGGDDVFYCNELAKKQPKEEMLDPCASDSKNKISECSDCDYDKVSNQAKKIKLEVPIESLYCTGVDSRRSKLQDESGFLLYNTEIEKGIHDMMDSSHNESEASQNFAEVEFGIAGLGYLKCIPSNNVAFDACDTEIRKNSCTEAVCLISDFDTPDDSKKKSQFQCRICNKTFPTYQALGGHQTFHRTPKRSVALKIEPCLEDTHTSILHEKTDGTSKLIKLEYNAMEEEVNGESAVTISQLNTGKEHKCHICSKNFVSGQALGGHKRAHIPKLKEEPNIAVKQEVPMLCDTLGINFSEVLDSEANHESGIKSWWAGNSYKHESLVDVIHN